MACCFLLLNILNSFYLLVLNFTWKHFWETPTKTTTCIFSKLRSDQNKTKNIKCIQNIQTIAKSILKTRQHLKSDLPCMCILEEIFMPIIITEAELPWELFQFKIFLLPLSTSNPKVILLVMYNVYSDIQLRSWSA